MTATKAFDLLEKKEMADGDVRKAQVFIVFQLTTSIHTFVARTGDVPLPRIEHSCFVVAFAASPVTEQERRSVQQYRFLAP